MSRTLPTAPASQGLPSSGRDPPLTPQGLPPFLDFLLSRIQVTVAKQENGPSFQALTFALLEAKEQHGTLSHCRFFLAQVQAASRDVYLAT